MLSETNDTEKDIPLLIIFAVNTTAFFINMLLQNTNSQRKRYISWFLPLNVFSLCWANAQPNMWVGRWELENWFDNIKAVFGASCQLTWGFSPLLFVLPPSVSPLVPFSCQQSRSLVSMTHSELHWQTDRHFYSQRCTHMCTQVWTHTGDCHIWRDMQVLKFLLPVL